MIRGADKAVRSSDRVAAALVLGANRVFGHTALEKASLSILSLPIKIFLETRL